MKVVKGLRDIHAERSVEYGRLSHEVTEVLKPQVENRKWFFLSRLKQRESFALKIETGRVDDPQRLEDFLGCTIVVPSTTEIEQAEKMVLDSFDLCERRPHDKSIALNRASDFAFADVRLYVARRPPASGRFPELDGAVFEVQIKTVLQYAWGVATHDLIYKTDTVSWPRQRIAFQVKAMLEHAELAIAKANSLAEDVSVAKSDQRTNATRELIAEIRTVWPEDQLPTDLRRLAETILNVFSAANVGVARFRKVIDAEKARSGSVPIDLSPYAFTIQALAHWPGTDLKKRLETQQHRRQRTKLVIHTGMDLPAWMRESNANIIDLG